MKSNPDGDPQHITGMTLIGENKSSRLRAIRDKAMFPGSGAPNMDRRWVSTGTRNGDADLSDELLFARQIIDQRLTSILSTLPGGKQKRLFKIRYGVELERIRELPIKSLFAILKIYHPSMNNLSANMKRIGDLNYNGEVAEGKLD